MSEDPKDSGRREWHTVDERVCGPDRIDAQGNRYLSVVAWASGVVLAQQIASEHNEHEALTSRVRELEQVLGGIAITLSEITLARGIDLMAAKKIYDQFGANWQAGLEALEQPPQ